jgi:maltose alpha-D-glucosyltransferase/alpha-amylase
MLDRLSQFTEKVLSKNKPLTNHLPPGGNFTEPIKYDNIPEEMKELLEGPVAERARLLGVRTGQMHLALASSNSSPDFKPENFSLHYQRSLFSSFQSLVRSTFQNANRALKRLPDNVRKEAEAVMNMKEDILSEMKKIYRKKFDAVKIRIHGDYHLGQVLFTGKDFVILDFEGEPSRSYSERRLKRSPLRDVAGMIRSFHYAAYGSLFLNEQVRKEDIDKLAPYVEQWYYYMSGFFMQAYLETVKGSAFIPEDKEDLDTMIQTYLLEKAIYELNYELNNRPDWLIIPIRGIKALMASSKLQLA